MKVGIIIAKRKTSEKIVNGKKYMYKKVTVGYDPLTNKPKRKDFYGNTVKELNEKIDRYMLNNELNSNNKETFGDFLEYWLINVKFIQGLSSSTIERYWGIYKNYILNIESFLKLSTIDEIDSKKLLIKDIPLINLNVTHIQDFYNTLYNINVSINTISFINKLIKPFITYAYTGDKIKKDFTNALYIPKKSKDYINYDEDSSPIEIFSIDEQHSFLRAIEGTREEVLYKVAISTGLRLGEILGLKWSYVDLDKKTLKVRLSARRIKDIITGESKLTLTSLKTTNSYSTLSLPAKLIPCLKEHKRNQDNEKSLAGSLYNDMDLVFATPLGGIIEPSNLRKRYKKILSQNNLPNRPFHSLRHTYASRLFEMGKNIVEVKELMRHKNISTTVDIYLHLTKEYKQTIINDFII